MSEVWNVCHESQKIIFSCVQNPLFVELKGIILKSLSPVFIYYVHIQAPLSWAMLVTRPALARPLPRPSHPQGCVVEAQSPS